MRKYSVLFVSLLLSVIIMPIIYAQNCLNHNGNPVDWWVILKVPPKIGKSGFGYYDSSFKSELFQYIPNHVDQGATALTMTLHQINNLNLKSVAWNDEKPNNVTSTTMAHSKGLISFSVGTRKGFLLSHSIPKYPAFTDHKVDIRIAQAENYYGQHLICVSMDLPMLEKMAQKLLITRLYIYENGIPDSVETKNLFQLASSHDVKISDKFYMADFLINSGFTLKTIYKNGFQNSSIFEDGLVNYFKQNVVAETWGRPLQPAWCSNYQVTNVKRVALNNFSWGEEDDHSKWAAVGTQFSCFGDMNRMPSQWKRGGSFFCFGDKGLASALRRAIAGSDQC